MIIQDKKQKDSFQDIAISLFSFMLTLPIERRNELRKIIDRIVILNE